MIDREREKLIKEIRKHEYFDEGGDCYEVDYGEIADFILADRKRIVEPLLREYPTAHLSNDQMFDICKNAIKETLKLSGTITNKD